MERPRFFLDTKATNSTSYETILDVQLSNDIEGLSYFSLAVDPDPKALYRILIGRILNVVEVELTAVWSLELPHLTSGVYLGFDAGDRILIQHRSTDPTVTVKTGATLAFNEVVG
jgi:hypothetical protein